MYSLYLYFLCLGLRNTSRALEPFKDENRLCICLEFDTKIWFIADLQEKKNIRIHYLDETAKQIGKSVVNISGYGSVLNLSIDLYFEYTSLMKEICL